MLEWKQRTSLDVVRKIGFLTHSRHKAIHVFRKSKGNTGTPSKEMAQELFNDGYRLIQRSPGTRRSFPRELSPFAPRNTALFHTYRGLYVSNVDVGSESEWNLAVAILKGRSDWVCCVSIRGLRYDCGMAYQPMRLPL